MIYKLTFLESAKKEWDKLDSDIAKQFKLKLKERLAVPRAPKDKLSGFKNCYKIKLKSAGYRLVYRVIDNRVVVQVIAVGKREKSSVYKNMQKRL